MIDVEEIQVEGAQAQVDGAQAQVVGARAQVEGAQAQVDGAQAQADGAAPAPKMRGRPKKEPTAPKAKYVKKKVRVQEAKPSQVQEAMSSSSDEMDLPSMEQAMLNYIVQRKHTARNARITQWKSFNFT